MASIEQLEKALVNADAAGDVDAARTFASEINRMRAAGSSGLSVDNVARQLATGVPVVGGLLNKANAATYAALSPLFPSDTTVSQAPNFGERYSENLSRENAKDKAFEESNPVTSTALNVVGGVASGVPMLRAVPAAFGAGSGGLLSRSLASAISGGAIGGTDAAIRSEGDVGSTGIGAGLGTAIGAVSPGLASAAGKGASYLADRFGGIGRPTGLIAALPRKAANYALDTIADPARQAQFENDLARLGPQATLADVSPEWMGVARGAASKPGMRDEIVNTLLNRDAGKNARLRADMDASLGRAPIPSQIEAGINADQGALSPRYQTAVAQAGPVNTGHLADQLDAIAINERGGAQRAARQVRDMLQHPVHTRELDQNPAALLSTRHAIDGMLETEVDPNTIRVLTQARRAVDEELMRAVPGIKEVDAQFAELARQNGALARGQQVLESGKTAPRPQELAQEVSQGALPQGEMIGPSAVPLRLRQGARAEIDRVVGTNANDPAALQRLVKSEGDWNRDRLRTLFGPRADDALNAIDRETTFYRTNNRVTSGSDTAMANRFGDFLDDAATPSNIPTDTTITGMLLRGAQKAGQKVLGANAEEKAARFARDLGRLSVAQGSERDELVRSLLDSARSRQSLEPIRSSAREVARLLLGASLPVANQRLLAK